MLKPEKDFSWRMILEEVQVFNIISVQEGEPWAAVSAAACDTRLLCSHAEADKWEVVRVQCKKETKQVYVLFYLSSKCNNL